MPGPVLRIPQDVKTLSQVQRQSPRLSGDGCFWLRFSLFRVDMDLSKPCLHRHTSSFTRFPSADELRFSKLTFESTDALPLRGLSEARRAWDKGLHEHAVQSGRLQPAEHQSVVCHTLGPLGSGIANTVRAKDFQQPPDKQ